MADIIECQRCPGMAAPIGTNRRGTIYRCGRTRSHVFTVEGAAVPSAHARTEDPETSHEAAASVTGITEKQQAVWLLLGEPRTDPDLAVEYMRRHREQPDTFPKQSMSGLRTRRSELVDAGKVHFTGEYLNTPSGRRAMLWQRTQI